MRFFKRLNNSKKGKYWWFNFTYRGVRYQESSKTTDKRKAADIAAAFRLRLIEGELDINRKQAAPVFSKAMAEFLKWAAEQHEDHPGTARRYEVASKPLIAFFGRALLDTITPEDVERYRAQRSRAVSEKTGRKLKPATINRELACLRVMINHTIETGAVKMANPVHQKRHFKPEKNERTRFLSFEEEQTYLDAASQPLKDLAILMLDSGLRIGEAVAVTKANVHLDTGHVFVPIGKTPAARRLIPLTQRAVGVLKARIENAAGPYLFPHEKDPDMPMIKPNNAHSGALRRTGLDHFTLHDLRHTYGSRMAMSGVDLVTLAALMGHSRIQMAMRYAHPSAEHKVNAVKKLEEFTAANQFEAFAAGDPALIN